MWKIARMGAVVAALCGGASAARAVDGLVPFNGTILAACVLTVGTPGVLVANGTYTELSSSAGGGLGGIITVLTTGASFKVSALAPSAFTLAPATGNDNVSFAAAYSGSGATTMPNTPGATQTSLGLGVTNVVVNLSATKASGNFVAGNYTATVTVRCE